MKKKLIYIFLFLIIYNSQAQLYKGYVYYQKESLKYLSKEEDFLKENEKQPDFLRNVSLIDKNVKFILEDLRFELVFNKHESIFKADEYLELEKNRFFRAALGPEGSAVYYNNLTEEVYLRQHDAYGEKFLIQTPKISWAHTNEVKKIGSYQCYKATAVVITNGMNGIIKYNIVAWYAPELSIPFGPLGFSGLPGLIMELEYQQTRYYVSKIDLSSKDKIEIKKPTQGKVVTKEEFDNIGNKIMKSLKNGF